MISAFRPLFSIALLSALIPATGHARLGENLSQLKARYGSPAPQEHRDPASAVWFFEGEDGQLVFSVTFDAKGESIAEGLKPLKLAVFPAGTVDNFVALQMAPYQGSKTMRVLKPGEKYTFAGRTLVCAEHESIVVDDPNRILVIWTSGGLPSVMALRPEMLR